MIDRKEFVEMRKALAEFDAKREHVIHLSRSIIALSKKIIYSVHRKDMDAASGFVGEIAKKVSELPSQSYDTGMDNVAKQEYAEALALYYYVKERRLVTREELKIGIEDYLIGLCDLTGELVRLAVNEGINGNRQMILDVKEFMTEIYGEFLNFDMRNGDLRKRFDAIKWNLRKLEDVSLEISLRK